MSYDLSKVTAEHVIEALKRIDGNRSLISPQKESTKYSVHFPDGKNATLFPPKAVLRLAYEIATGEKVDWLGKSGGDPTNKWFEKLRKSDKFGIVERKSLRFFY